MIINWNNLIRNINISICYFFLILLIFSAAFFLSISLHFIPFYFIYILFISFLSISVLLHPLPSLSLLYLLIIIATDEKEEKNEMVLNSLKIFFIHLCMYVCMYKGSRLRLCKIFHAKNIPLILFFFLPAWLNPIPTPTSEVSSGGKSRTLGMLISIHI